MQRETKSSTDQEITVLNYIKNNIVHETSVLDLNSKVDLLSEIIKKHLNSNSDDIQLDNAKLYQMQIVLDKFAGIDEKMWDTGIISLNFALKNSWLNCEAKFIISDLLPQADVRQYVLQPLFKGHAAI